MIHEILISVIGSDPDEAHAAIVQMAESRKAHVEEVAQQRVTEEDGDEVNAFCVEARLTGGVTYVHSRAV
jgi:HPt (histidine-containing phosphotransfer) domain-containing protein